ncbi:MAG: hypothetical protein ACRCSV_00925 [Chlamydiales bacterium]
MINRKTILPISICIIFISFICMVISGYHLLHTYWTIQSPQESVITTIIQCSPEKNSLQTDFFAELLSLSQDSSVISKKFNIKKSCQILKSFPIMKECSIDLDRDTLYINYELRQPVAYLGNYYNVGIDKEGVLFPISPFFSIKRLPLIYVHDSELPDKANLWGYQITSESMKIALDIVAHTLEIGFQEKFLVRQIDVASLLSDAYAKREIILIVELMESHASKYLPLGSHILRLNPKKPLRGIDQYLILKKELVSTDLISKRIFDLRLPDLAFIR